MKPRALFESLVAALKERLRRIGSRLLNQPVAAYELRAPNDMARLYRCIRKGDVVLVEGELRISQFVKYVTQSQWSHCALYVGDELLRRGGALRGQALARFGELADHVIVEALTEEGVIAAPLAKYEGLNIRICRPSGIDPADLDRVLESVLADLGKRYDERNFLDLALMLLSPVKFGPLKARTIHTCLGNCTDLEVMCSGMIAKAFQRVGYPVLPHVDSGLALRTRHYSQIVPRDFDLSPYFQIIKSNVVEDGAFDYRRLIWKQADAEPIGLRR